MEALKNKELSLSVNAVQNAMISSNKIVYLCRALREQLCSEIRYSDQNKCQILNMYYGSHKEQ